LDIIASGKSNKPRKSQWLHARSRPALNTGAGACPGGLCGGLVLSTTRATILIALFHCLFAKKIPWTCVLDHTIAVAAVQLLLPLTAYRSGDAEPLIGRQTSASHLWCR
jgi:hypothetical protein